MAGTNFKVKNGLEIQSGTLVVSNGAGSSGQVLKSTGTGVEWGTGSSGSGDVVGPASSTDNAVTRFDSTTGKLIQNSTVTLDDNGNFDNVNSVVLDNTPATLPTGAGTIYWEDGEGTPEVILKGGNTLVKVGTQEYARVYNDSGSTVTKGQVVYISGAQGNRISVKLARADVEANSFGTLGFVAETITNGAEGWVIVSGALYKLNTLGLTAGATVYLSPTTAGAYTTTKPQAPDQLVVLGFIERVSSTVGSIYVKVDNGYELDELHDVRITSPISGNTLIYDATTSPTGVWKNASLTAGTGISVTNGAGSITIGNTGVTSVSGTSPIVSSGGATPAISIPAATSSVNGYLTSGDWTNFNTGYTDRLKWDGGATGLTASTGRTSLGATTLGANIFTITNPSAVTFPRFNADNTVSSLDATTFRTAIGAGTGNGSVTSVAAGTYLTGGTITTSGTLAVDATSNNTASKVVARDGSGNFSAGTITATLSGNASTATSAATLTTARTINTTSFNGSADITIGSKSNIGTPAAPGTNYYGTIYVSQTASPTGGSTGDLYLVF